MLITPCLTKKHDVPNDSPAPLTEFIAVSTIGVRFSQKKHVPLVPQLLAFNTKRLFTFRFCQTAPSLVRYWFFVFENIGLYVFGKTLGFVFQNEFMLSRHFVAFRIGRADR